MKVCYKKLHPDAHAPVFSTEHSAGMDLCAATDTIVPAGEVTIIPTGIAVEIPDNHAGILALRSSTPKKKGLFSPHGVGIIDADYRGELMVQVCSLKNEDVLVCAGERIAQLIIMPARAMVMEGSLCRLDGVKEVESLSETVRSEGGFGSTG